MKFKFVLSLNLKRKKGKELG
jgi:hypothetical protein